MAKRKLSDAGTTPSVASFYGDAAKPKPAAEKPQHPEKKAKPDEQAPKTNTEADLPWEKSDPEVAPFYEIIYKVEMPVPARGLYCRVCQKAKKGGIWDSAPHRSVRARWADKHCQSKEHKDSLAAISGQGQIGDAVVRDKDEEVFSAWVAKLECIYWLCKEEVASCSLWMQVLGAGVPGGQRQVWVAAGAG